MTKKKAPHTTTGRPHYTASDMDLLLRGAGIELDGKQLALLWQYHNLLRRYNPELNLTRIHSFENMVLKLYADALLPGRMTDLPSPLLDLGTGAGMPGIPLKIAHPDIEMVLAESRQHRVAFLRQVIRELDLSGIRVYAHAVTPACQIPVAGVITRAVERMDKTLDRVRGCLCRGGQIIFMKGPHCDDEVAEARDTAEGRFRLAEDIAYQIPDTPHERRLVIFERTDAPLRQYREKAMAKHRIRTADSPQNQTFKDLKKLLTGRGARKQGRAIISGTRQVQEIVSAFPAHCLAWISKSDQWPPPEDVPAHADWYQLDPQLFETIDVIGTNAPLLLVKTPSIPGWEPRDGLPEGCSVLVPFQDPENVGALIRSAVAFGADTVILLSEAAHPFHPRAVRASGGSVMHANMMEGPSIRDLPAETAIVALSADGTPIPEFAFPESFALLPGLEGPGLPAHLRRNTVSIPIRPEIESLNAAAAAAIALYAWSQQKRSE